MISKRLKSIAQHIDCHDKVIDIGCDHALLDIYLCQKLNCRDIIASDIKQSALNQAIFNIDKYNCSKFIKPILSDGFKNIDSKNYDTLIISGMGTKTIKEILSFNEQVFKKIIIQTNNCYFELRKFMTNNNYIIKKESLIQDKSKYYQTIMFVPGSKKYKSEELLYGPFLTQDKSNIEYFKNLYQKKIKIYQAISLKEILKRKKMDNEIKILKKVIEKMLEH